MDQKPNFSAEDVKRIAQSKAGQDLYALLQQTQSQQLKDAMAQAAAGDMEQVKRTVTAMMDSPEAKALLDQLRR